MAFHEGTFAARLGTMGDPAEAAFDAINPKHHKLGLNRPNLYVGRMDRKLRYTPDRMTEDWLVECMGIGRDQTLKLKCEKAVALLEWNSFYPTELFVYDSHKQRYWQAPVHHWIDQVFMCGALDFFPENNKPYWKLLAKHFPSKPHKMPPAPIEAQDAA